MIVERLDDQVLIDGQPAEYIGKGADRVVYGTDDVVVKFPRVEGYTDQIDHERRFWERVKDTPEAKHFAPVLAVGPNWIAMRRVKQAARSPEPSDFTKVHDLRKLGLVDLHSHNWMLDASTNEPVVVDYGL